MNAYRSRRDDAPVPHHTIRSTGPGPVLVYLGSFAVTPMRAVVIISFLGSSAFIAWAIIKVRDSSQIPMLSSGFLILGIACAAIAIGALIELWRAAIRARMARAVGMAIGGGLFGLAAIGCFTATILFALLQKS